MTPESASSLLRVTDPKQVRAFTDQRTWRFLRPFLGRENTVGAAARELGEDIRPVHRGVRRLEEIGVLRVTRAEPRGGRPIKHYRAVADAFFVPFSATSAADLAELSGKEEEASFALLRRALGRAMSEAVGDLGEWGIRLYPTPQPPYYAQDQMYAWAELRPPETGWQGPDVRLVRGWPEYRLTEAEARQLQEDVLRVILHYRARSHENAARGAGHWFLGHFAFAPITDEEHLSLGRVPS